MTTHAVPPRQSVGSDSSAGGARRRGATAPRWATAALIAGSLRSGPVDDDLVSRLAAAGSWPPLLVHRATGAVVDGAHRLAAARLCGMGSVAVVEVDGDADAAFLAGVRENTRSGRPLNIIDRRRAVERLVVAFPALSDRELQRVTGASAGVARRARAQFGVPSLPAPRRAGPGGTADQQVPRRPSLLDVGGELRRLAADPSMRCGDGAALVRSLHTMAVALRELQSTAQVPAHQRQRVAQVLRWCASNAQATAGALDDGSPR